MIQSRGPLDPERDYVLRLADGRRLSFRQYGAADGQVVLALHGTPGSRLKYRATHDEAVRLGLRIIAPDRWGYGVSKEPSQPTLSTYSGDIVELMEHCRVDRFTVVGISGGGPFAAAIAAGLPGRVAGLALVAPVGRVSQFSDVSMAPADRTRMFHHFCFRILPRIPGGTRAIFSFYRLLVFVAPACAISLALSRSTPADRRTMGSHERRLALGRTFAAGLANGSDGAVIDLDLFAKEWDVDMADIRCPSRLWIGEVDHNVPIGAAIALARDIPSAEISRISGQGHFWISDNFTDVLTWLREAGTNAQDTPPRQIG